MILDDTPTLDDLLTAIGDAGARVNDIGASEASAGNISVYIASPLDVEDRFTVSEDVKLPWPAPSLSGGTLLVSGSGRRLRQIQDDPEANVGALRVHAGGRTATLLTSPRRRFTRLTSELNSHLAVHDDHVRRRDVGFHALVHAQPPNLTYLSHVPIYRDTAVMNLHLLRWEPETVVALPQGIAVLDFMVPGSEELQQANVDALADHDVVLWSKHGVMARSDVSVRAAVDRIDYAEAAARYEYMDLLAGGRGQGLTNEELTRVASAFDVASPWA